MNKSPIKTTREIVKIQKVVLRSKQGSNGVGGGGKRITCKSNCKEQSVSIDEIKRSPV